MSSLSDINPQIDSSYDGPSQFNGSAPAHRDGSAPVANGAALKDAVVNNAAAAANAVANHPITQDLANGPAAQSVRNQANATTSEFSNLSNARNADAGRAANGSSLTNYHSFFYTLLSWEHPRATAITFASSVLLIFACRYLPVMKWLLKMTYMVLGVVTITEVAAKLVMGSSVASSVRPRKYYKIPKENLEASLDDLEQLINFFVIEFQRIIFAENVPATAAVFLSAFLSYYLIKILPFWGMALLSTCVIYLAPLIYVQNKDLIDSQLEHASSVIGQQASQVKDLTAQHTSKGLESVKAYTGDYAAKASQLVGQSRQKIPMPATNGTTGTFKEDAFPSAPKTDLPPSSAEHTKPLVYAPTEDEPIAVSSA